MPNILLCTLGASWAVIPEAYAFLAPQQLPLYAQHPLNQKFAALRNEYQLQAPDEVWICSTKGKQTENSLDTLHVWATQCSNAPKLRIWQAEHTDQLANQQECDTIRELIVRACLKAYEYAAGGQIVLSLAGGRKTMSADLQWAANLFGCQALLHVISNDEKLRETPLNKPEQFIGALPAELAGLITPLIAGRTTRNDLLDINSADKKIITTLDYPLPLPENEQISLFTDTSLSLSKELHNREQESSRLLGNYLATISQQESHENWRSLYRLPPRRINQLQQTSINASHRILLQTLPKADLHRHLGGCLTLPDQQKVAQAIWQTLSLIEQHQSLGICQSLLDNAEWTWHWPELIRNNGVRSHNVACLLLHANQTQLNYNLWGVTEPRIGIKMQRNFDVYERPGELSGSALLSHPASITAYAQAIVLQAQAEGLAYVELRGSPQKYVCAQQTGIEFLAQFYSALNRVLQSTAEPRTVFNFIIIADRRDYDQLNKTIQLAVEAKKTWPDFIGGLDLAGDESQTSPEQIANLFNPVFAQCLPITIHAGEGEAADSIWQAAYHLHADRIGHGLTLSDDSNLAQRFRNRNICLELCPTSNREVVGYYDPAYPTTAAMPKYPLLEFWRIQGLPLSICTDNPGISRTTLADEYITAARMCDYQINLWEALAMIKQGFVHAFLPGAAKEKLIKAVDQHIYNTIMETEL